MFCAASSIERWKGCSILLSLSSTACIRTNPNRSTATLPTNLSAFNFWMKQSATPRCAQPSIGIFSPKSNGFTIANAIDYFAAQGKTVSAESFEPFYHWTVSVYGNRLVVFSSLGTAIEFSDGEWTESRGLFLYDLKTGQPLEWQQLLVDGWEEQAYFSPDPWSSSQMLPLVKEDIPAKIYNIQLTPSEYPLRLWFLSADGKHRRQDICLPVECPQDGR